MAAEYDLVMRWGAAADGLGAGRGVIAPGMRADLNVIDLDALSVGRPYLVNDLPTGAKRRMQRASGYVASAVGGETTHRDGAASGAPPGRLLRGPQPAPQP